MKLRITIVGERVQDVGYRLHLLSMARGLVGFEAENVDKDKVVIYVEGQDDAVSKFRETVDKTRPPMAKVSSISYEAYDGLVLPISEYRSQLSLEQLVKIAQTGLEMRDDIKEMKGDIKEIKGDVKEMKGDIKEIKEDTKEIKEDTKNIRTNVAETGADVKRLVDTQAETLNEVRALRSDFKTYVDERLKRLEADVQAIKQKLGLTT